MFNGLVKYDETFFTSLARVLNEETVQPRDLQMMGMLLPLGIEKGKEFKPEAATVPMLTALTSFSDGLTLVPAVSIISHPATTGPVGNLKMGSLQ